MRDGRARAWGFAKLSAIVGSGVLRSHCRDRTSTATLAWLLACPIRAARASGAPLLLCCLLDSVVWLAPGASSSRRECPRSPCALPAQCRRHHAQDASRGIRAGLAPDPIMGSESNRPRSRITPQAVARVWWPLGLRPAVRPPGRRCRSAACGVNCDRASFRQLAQGARAERDLPRLVAVTNRRLRWVPPARQPDYLVDPPLQQLAEHAQPRRPTAPTLPPFAA